MGPTLWKIGGVLLAGVAAYFLVTMYGSARYEAGKQSQRAEHSLQLAKANQNALVQFKAGLDLRQAAEVRYVETVRQLPPVTHTVIERSTEYAQTPAGSAMCLDADRVLWLDETRARLFPAGTASPGGASGALPADASGP